MDTPQLAKQMLCNVLVLLPLMPAVKFAVTASSDSTGEDGMLPELYLFDSYKSG